MSEKRGSSRLEALEATVQLRRGPWTPEEDNHLIQYIAYHGEGHWNLLARNSGLKRTGKSCRLRWLNYLKPDVKRGNLSPQEQLMILQLHSKWGNRWSRIAQHLPGRTDNEIKNYWRTRVQKKERQLKIDASAAIFQDAIRCCWTPRLLEKINSLPSVQSSAPIDQNMLMSTTDYHSPQVSVIQDCCFSSLPHELSEAWSADQRTIASNSSLKTNEAICKAPRFIDFPATPSDELGSISFVNPFHNFDEVSMDTSDQSTTTSSSVVKNCTSDSSTGDPLISSMDELYAILKAYMNGNADSDSVKVLDQEQTHGTRID